MPKETLTEDQLEVFQELINVAYGTATASIANIIDAHATLAIPNIVVIPSEDILDFLQQKFKTQHKHNFCKQQFFGKFSGESLLIIDNISSINLAKEFDFNDSEIDDDVISETLLEITNILSSSTIGILSEQLDSSASFSPPELEQIDSIEKIDQNHLQLFNKIVIISTELSFKDQSIYAEYLLLTGNDSFLKLKTSLQEIVDRLL